MAIYRPLKRIIIPIVALLIGFSLAYLFMPTKQDYEWGQWKDQIQNWEKGHYEITSSYEFDKELADTVAGKWSKTDTQYRVSAVVSNDTSFDFDLYIEGEGLYIHSGDQWVQGEINSRFMGEIAPIDNPFQWMSDLLLEADHVERKREGEKTTYIATFTTMNEFDFRGHSLVDQQDTHLTVVEKNGVIQSLLFEAVPIAPEHIGIFDLYPEHVLFSMNFTEIDDVSFSLPQEAYESEGLD